MNFLRLVVLPLILAGILSSRPHAESYGPINVQEIQLAENRSDETVHGYVEYRFRVSNRDSKPHHVALRIVNERSYSESTLVRTTNEVIVPPETSVTISLLQPVVNMPGNGETHVIIDGRLQKEPTRFFPVVNHLPAYTRRSNETANVFVSQLVPSDIRDLIRTGTPVTPPPGGATPPTPSPILSPEVISWLANAPVGEWSENWLAYTRFDGVILTGGEWRDLSDQFPGVMAALRKYTEAGGCLCIVGTDWTPPKEWKDSAGFGEVRTIAGTLTDATPQIDPLRDLFLQRVKPWESALDQSPASRAAAFRGGGGTGSMTGGVATLNALPVIESYGVPVKLIMILIVVFAVLIGPVNIYVLSLMKRRIWLLWTVPVTSLIASALVLGVNFVQEGFLKQSGSMTTTILDQRTGEATTIGYVGFYSTLMPRGGILFDADTEATACFHRGYGENRALELDIVGGGSQRFSRGWISARVPAYFAIRKAQSHRKERIVFDWDASPPTATNGLGVDIGTLKVRSPSGEAYKIDNILKAGQQAPLLTDSIDGSLDPGEELRSLLQKTIQNGPTTALDSKMLTNGTYRAVTGTWNPFVEPGIEGMKPYRNLTTVYGIF